MPRRSHNSWKQTRATTGQVNRCRALLVIDNRPLQAAAWADLRRARKLLEQASRNVHRHEETDEPAFRAWIATTFPTLVSAVREIATQVETKGRIVEAVERESFFTGRSVARIWREWQQSEGRPSEPTPDRDRDDGEPATEDPAADAEAAFEAEMKRLFGDDDSDDDDPFAGLFGDDDDPDIFGSSGTAQKSKKADEARAIYRRLVQHLHPDRGGAWTPARARVWEQMQAAWEARDADWLARLEAEWEASADLLGPTSAIGRLRAALMEIDAARRDAEKRLRKYRKDVAWRFSLRPPSEALRQKLKQQLLHDERLLRRQLDEIEATMTRWSKTRARRRKTQPRPRNFGF